MKENFSRVYLIHKRIEELNYNEDENFIWQGCCRVCRGGN